MTAPLAKPKLVAKTVVIFDICSSTAILEDLVKTESHVAWQAVLGELKRFLWSRNCANQMYKFLGDGWILLFDEMQGDQLVELLQQLSAAYEALYFSEVEDRLSNKIEHIGMTFGVDQGSLVEVVMNRRTEYVGRAINVAARLQSATKAQDERAEGLLLVSPNASTNLGLNKRGPLVECKLANVAGGTQYRARKIRVYP